MFGCATIADAVYTMFAYVYTLTEFEGSVPRTSYLLNY